MPPVTILCLPIGFPCSQLPFCYFPVTLPCTPVTLLPSLLSSWLCAFVPLPANEGLPHNTIWSWKCSPASIIIHHYCRPALVTLANTQTNKLRWQTGHLLMNCTVVSFSTVHFCVDCSDFALDDSRLTTARSWMPQLLPHFSKASHPAKTIFFLPASVLRENKLKPSSVNFVEHPEADTNDFCKVCNNQLCEQDRQLASHNPFSKP